MNWVGGSRNRFVMKSDAKKQREFFEKRKMQQKLKNLGIALPTSPRGTTSGSMDLVTLFIVNQIAAKKEIKDPPKVAVLGSCKGGSKHKRSEPLVLPMSLCSPSQLSLVEGQPQYSVQGARKRKHVIPQGFKCRQLSPVVESAFSDNSASDYLPRKTDPLSPFSSTSSASSGQGIFPPQLNLQQRPQTQAQPSPFCSPAPWDTSGLEQTKFQPFSYPRGMTNSTPWSCGSNPPLYQMDTPTAARALFRSPEPDNTEARNQARHEVAFSLNQSEDREPVLDFTFNPSETEQQLEGDIFRGFSAGEGEASHFGRGKSKIYLKDETAANCSTPQTVPDSMEVGGSSYMNLSNYSDINFSCPEHNSGPVKDCEYSPSYSSQGGYCSSDSDDDEECCEPCLQAASSYVDQACCAEKPNLGSQQRHTKARPPTPLLKPKINPRDNQKVRENLAFPGSYSQQERSNAAQFASSQTQSSEMCKCKKTSTKTRDAGTQTVDNNSTAERCDAATQCSDAVEEAPVDASVQRLATGRQSDTAAEPCTPSSGMVRSGGKKKSRAGSLPGSSVTPKHTANSSEGKVILQGPINPFLHVSMTDGRGKESRDERGQQENDRLMKDLSSEVMEGVTSATRANRLSEEAETLQEIADILLLLTQKKKVM